MLVILLGIVIDVRLEQPSKAPSHMLLTLLGMVTDFKPEQREKAQLPMRVTLFGIVIDVRLEQLSKALSAIPNVPFSNSICVPAGVVPLYL